MNTEMMTPTQREIVQRHRSFRQSIAEKAAALLHAKEPPVAPVMPEAIPAEPDPPKLWFSIIDCRPIFPTHPSICEIQKTICTHYKARLADLISKRRTHDIVRPRQVGYYLSKNLTPNSLPSIGRKFGGRDHSSVLSGIRKITRLLITDAELRGDIEAICESLGVTLA